jgi:hypothetical protein
MVLFLTAGTVLAQDPKPIDAKAFDKAVVDSLREVHHVGRELFNTGKDFGATYRVYQGSLMTVKPLLAHRPEVQKLIDAGLAAAEKEPEMARKAFMLHETIEKSRSALRTAAEMKTETKIPEAKKPDPPVKKPEEAKGSVEKKTKEMSPVAPDPKKKAADDTAKKAAGGPGFRGKVTLNGKPLRGVDVVFVSLDLPKPRVFSATTQADGQYAPTEVLPAAKYVAIVTGKGVPEKYTTTTTSPLRVEVKQPPTVFDIELK